MTTLQLTDLKGIGGKTQQKLHELGLKQIQDVLFHLPHRYVDRTRIVEIGTLGLKQTALIEGEVLASKIVYGRRRMLLVSIGDITGTITLRFFHFSAAQAKPFVVGKIVRAFGEVNAFNQSLEMVHPEYRILKNDDDDALLETTLTPIYPATDGITQKMLRNLTDQVLIELDKFPALLQEYFPESILETLQHPTLLNAVKMLHRPSPDIDLSELDAGTHPCQQRLIFEELLSQRLSLLKLRAQKQNKAGIALDESTTLVPQLIQALPYQLTHAQQRTVDEITQDLNQPHPMLRLVQGDVGSGKTVVAAVAALTAIENGVQVALMAPTEILAEQHAHAFRAWFEPLGIDVAFLVSKLKTSTRNETLARIESGEAKLIIGTHAIFQDEVHYHNIGLVIVDEQHRFGVHQRLALKEKARTAPHQLIMTATPIPRTLAMTAYADLVVSTIDELPPGRTPIKTVMVNNSRRDEITARIEVAAQSGNQIYWVCPLIEESEALNAQSAVETFEALQTTLPNLRVGLIHGRLKPAEKESVMHAFASHALDLLVATTVIEVGVNVPNATLMVIENAERLGLAQLHQLRGRVGRGDKASSCVLMYQAPLSTHAAERLSILRETTDGFKIAEKDLQIRGPGEVLGTRQTGVGQFKVVDLIRDAHLLPSVAHTATQIVQQHPDIIDPLIQRWIGDKINYAKV